MSELRQQIKSLLEEVRQIEKIKRHLENLESRLAASYQSLDKLTQVLEQEFEDVDQLEKLSLKGLFYKVLGSKEEQQEKERQEYLQAALKYDEVRKAIDLLEYEKKVLLEKLDKKGDVAGTLEELLAQRERNMIRENTLVGKELLNIQRQTEGQQILIREVEEALMAGVEAAQVLEEVAGFLRAARNWGKWDMGSRGRGAAHFKHSNIDRAKERAYFAQQLLNRFQDELYDIYDNIPGLNLQLELDSFSRFIDVLFDNLISDWMIQQKILNALSNVNAVKDRVLRLLKGLEKEEQKAQQEILQLQAARKKILSN